MAQNPSDGSILKIDDFLKRVQNENCSRMELDDTLYNIGNKSMICAYSIMT